VRIKTKEDYKKVMERNQKQNNNTSLPLGRKHLTKSGKKKENK